MHLVQFDDASMENLHDLKRSLGCDNVEQVIRTAIILLSVADEAKKQGIEMLFRKRGLFFDRYQKILIKQEG